MLSNELMGLLALWILWVNTILVAADAIRRYRALAREVSGWTEGGLVSAKVLEGQGPGGCFAELELSQLGRAADGKQRTIHWGQAELRGRTYGGRVEIDGQSEPIAPGEAIVWPMPERTQAALAHDAAEDFESAYQASTKHRGHVRVGHATIDSGQQIWIVPGVLVSAIDPQRWLARQSGKVVGFIIISLLLATVCTIVAVWPPVFGLVSKIGAVAALAFFLLIQPAGTALRDRILPPHRALHRSVWVEPKPTNAPVTSQVA